MRRIALATEDNQGLTGQISQHFGRCPYYLIVQVEGLEIEKSESVNNPYYNSHALGMVPQFINEQGVNVMIAGGMGPRAIDMFTSLGVEAVSGATGNVGNTLQAYLTGDITGVKACGHDYPGGHNHH